MKYHQTEILPSYLAAMQTLQAAIAAGWTLDPANPPEIIGFAYSLSLVRDDEPVVKLNREQILAKARAAKVAKAQNK